MESDETTPASFDSHGTTKDASEIPENDDAFLVQSQDTSSQNITNETEYERSARQKRRRTSPQDQAILEAEYERNSKPDKATRMEIVSRVTLGEKEVQIWFQNRRQMTRRKSRPLLPHEVIANFYSSQSFPSLAPSPNYIDGGSSQSQQRSCQNSFDSNNTSASSVNTDPKEDEMANAAKDSLDSSSSQPSFPESDQVQNDNSKPSVPLGQTSMHKPGQFQTKEHSPSLTRSLSQKVSSRRDQVSFANRRRASFIVHDEYRSAVHLSEGPRQTSNGSNGDASIVPRTFKRTSSHVRLSLSLNGKAEVTTATGETPSPPRSQPMPVQQATPRPIVGLQRSYSALEPCIGKVPVEGAPLPRVKRPMAGRSRDARTWEFYCDSDARNALTEQAEREESGSATAAISVIRSRNNNNRIPTTNSNKRNAHTQKPDSTKRIKADNHKHNRQPLGRATSSLARLQTTYSNVQKQTFDKASQDKVSSKPRPQDTVDPYGDADSDKENWEPGTQTTNPRRRRPMRTQDSHRILEESLRVPSQSSSLDAHLYRESIRPKQSSSRSSSSEDKENSVPGLADDMAESMGKAVPREVEDLDCVQNLLSLSQAAWQ